MRKHEISMFSGLNWRGTIFLHGSGIAPTADLMEIARPAAATISYLESLGLKFPY